MERDSRGQRQNLPKTTLRYGVDVCTGSGTSFKAGGQELDLGAVPQCGSGAKLMVGFGGRRPEADDNNFVKICYSVTVLRMT